MYIGLISDTHGVFSPEFKKFLEPVDQIWHAGDFGGGMDMAKEIADFKPLLGVAGNCDNYNLRFEHPIYRFFECGGLKVLMTHIGGYPGNMIPRRAGSSMNFARISSSVDIRISLRWLRIRNVICLS